MPVKTIRNIAFSALAAVIFCSAIGYTVLGMVNHDWQRPAASNMERRDYVTFKDVVSKSIQDGEAQDAMEQFMADRIPYRDAVMLLNASLQAQGIRTAGIPFGMEAYPSYYGSGICEIPEAGVLVERSKGAPNAKSPALKAWLDTINKAAAEHGDVRFYYASVLESCQSEVNPTYALRSGNLMNSAWVERNILQKLHPSIHSTVVMAQSPEEVYAEWMGTDTHWSLQAALKAYNAIGGDLGWKAVEWENPVKVVDVWRGSYARGGLDLRYRDVLFDMDTDFTHLSFYRIADDVLSPEPGADPGKRSKTLKTQSRKMKQGNPFQGYSTYYGTFNGLIVNGKGGNGKNCLIIGDSMTHCLKRYIADNYANTYSILPGNFPTSWTLERYIEEYDIDDVVVLCQALKYLNFKELSPAFIGLDKGGAGAAAEGDESAEL